MLPDRKPMINLAMMLEAAADDVGWGYPPVLGVAYDNGAGFATLPTPWQPMTVLPSNPAEALSMIADSLFLHSAKYLLREEKAREADATCGVWFLNEAWAVPKQNRVPGVGPKETFGARKMRICTVIDCAGRLYLISRFRGKGQESEVVESGWESTSVVVEGLRRIVLALGHAMGPEMIDKKALYR